MVKEYTLDDVNVLEPSQYDRKFKYWNENRSYEIHSENGIRGKILRADMFGGCGMQQIYGWYNWYQQPEIKLCLQKLIEDVKKPHSYRVGLLMCQIGSKQYDSVFEKALIDEGFKLSIEYDNLAHTKGDTQRIYFLEIER